MNAVSLPTQQNCESATGGSVPPPFQPRLKLLAVNYHSGATQGRNLGVNGYSYDFVFRQFAPLLSQFADVEVTTGGSDLEARVHECRHSRRPLAQIGFRALHEFDLVDAIPNIAVPAWEFPDLPDASLTGRRGDDWAAVANSCDLILHLCEFTRDAFERAGVTTRMAVVPVPVAPTYFDVDAWDPRRNIVLETPAIVLESPRTAARRTVAPTVSGPNVLSTARSLASAAYKRVVRPCLPWWLDRGLAAGVREVQGRRAALHSGGGVSTSCVELSGFVYTSVFNPYDGRKNWEDLLSGFLLALGDRPDVTLVLKLVRNDRFGAEEVVAKYRALGISHRCRIVLLTGFLSEEQMTDLARATTYYITTTRAEGACLPLMQWLAAGRPAVAPRHSAIADYFSEDQGFAVASHPEPCAWPHDPQKRLRTTWHRLVWTSLVDQLRASLRCAEFECGRYADLSSAARSVSLDRHHPDRASVLLEQALRPLAIGGATKAP